MAASESAPDGDEGRLSVWSLGYDRLELIDIPATHSLPPGVASSPPLPHRRRIAVYEAGGAEKEPGPALLLLHGANYSAVSFVLLVAKLKKLCRVVAFDAAGHGRSDDVEASLDTEGGPRYPVPADLLADDCVQVALHAFHDSGSRPTAVVLVGHSMGAAIASLVASRWPATLPPLQGLVLMDMVEKTAMEAIPRMRDAISRFPSAFPSPEEAIAWTLHAGILRLPASARITVPYHLRRQPGPDTPAWGWRAWDFLVGSAADWPGWFAGTNARFLTFPGKRLLILSDVDSLDADLTVAQMRGQFQLSLVAGAGHVLHEDAPDKVAEIIGLFLSRAGLTADVEAALLREKLKRAQLAAGMSPPK